MNSNSVDLKQLMLLIHDQKDIQANLCLDEGCTLETEDPKPLIKMINYTLNYLTQLTEQPLEIALDLQENGFTLRLMALTEQESLPELSDNLDSGLSGYGAVPHLVHDKGRYVQVNLQFKNP